MASSPFRARAGVLVRPIWPGFFVLGLSLVALVTLLVPWNEGPMSGRMPAFWMVEGLLVLASLLARARLARQRALEREVTPSAEGLAIEGVVVAPRASIRSAVVHPAAGAPARVRVVQRFGRPMVDVDAASVADARAIVDALGHGVAQHTVRFAAQRRSILRMLVEQVIFTAAFMALFVTTAVHFRLHGAAALVVLAVPLLVPALRPIQNVLRVEVGADGFVVRPILGRNRFVRYADVRDVRDEGSKVVVAVRDAKDVELHFASAAELGRIVDQLRADRVSWAD